MEANNLKPKRVNQSKAKPTSTTKGLLEGHHSTSSDSQHQQQMATEDKPLAKRSRPMDEVFLEMEETPKTRVASGIVDSEDKSPQFKIAPAGSASAIISEGEQQAIDSEKEKILRTVTDLVQNIVGDVSTEISKAGYPEFISVGGIRTLIPQHDRPPGVIMSKEFPQIKFLLRYANDIVPVGRGPTPQTVDMFHAYTKWMEKDENIAKYQKKKKPIKLAIPPLDSLTSDPNEAKKTMEVKDLGFLSN